MFKIEKLTMACDCGCLFMCRKKKLLTVDNELDELVSTTRHISISVNGADIDAIVPPHHFRDHQVSL